MTTVLLQWPLSAEPPWLTIKVKNGITLFKRTFPDSPISEFKGETMINARIEVIETVLRDIPAYAQFMFNCKEGRLIKSFGKDNLIILNVTDMPWPLTDRDVVVRSIVSKDFKRGVFTIVLQGLPEPESSQYCPLRKDRVRMHNLQGIFILEIVDREHTSLTYIVHADPVGIPSVLTNFFSDDNPYGTLTGIKRMVCLEKYITESVKSPEIPKVEQFLKTKGDNVSAKQSPIPKTAPGHEP
jgi:hypothetical protein